MKMQKRNIAYNLTTLRQLNKFSQEEVAERIGVSRQAVAKWETGQSIPDILNCDALAKLYDVELDDLIHYDQEQTGESIPPKGKHIFGTVRVGERGQIVLPKQARDVFKIKIQKKGRYFPCCDNSIVLFHADWRSTAACGVAVCGDKAGGNRPVAGREI